MKDLIPALALALALAGCVSDAPVSDPEPLPAETSPFPYPIELWDEGVEGDVVLLVHVTAGGAVDSVAVDRSSGYAAFDSVAVAGARTMRFSPARRGEERIDAWIKLPVRFRRAVDEDTTRTPARPEG